MTNLYTCLDGFAYSKGHVRDRFEEGLLEISHHVSNSLAMLKKLPAGVKKLASKNEVFPGYGKIKDGFPRYSRFYHSKPEPHELAARLCIPRRGFELNADRLLYLLVELSIEALSKSSLPGEEG